jgi:uncharacterized protein YutE (UPF0331/DUF86 family)
MLQFNLDKLTALTSEVRKALERLESIRSLNKIDFLNNQDKIDSAKYNFIVAIESAIDICNHIISQNGYRVPKDYGDTFQILFEQGAFNSEFIKNLKAMAKFRNRLVHIYWEVDNEKIYSFLQSNLLDFRTFLNKIAEFLNLENF